MIELKNVSYVVSENGKETAILENVSYVFKKGLVTAITGQNGSGKSTLTKLIIGIIQPTSGQIFFNGTDITNLSITERANLGLNYAFQKPVTFKGLSVVELINIATKENNSISKACSYLSKVGLCAKEYIHRMFDDSLSGGEQKRIELALALAKQGECFIFDEPEAGIDLWSFDKLGTLLESGKTHIIVSHQEKFLKRADQILVLNKGKIQYSGNSKDVLAKLGDKTCARIKGGKDEIR